MSKYASRQFWVDVLDRCISTVAQAAIGALTADVTGLLDIDWTGVASVAGLAGLVSVLTSVAFRGRTEDGSTGEVTYDDVKDEVLARHVLLTTSEQEADIQAALSRRLGK